MKIGILIVLMNLAHYISCDSCEKEKKSISYDKNENDLHIPNEWFLVFESGFDDSIYVYNNNTLVGSDYYKTDESTSFTGKVIKITNSIKTSNSIRVLLKDKNRCLEFEYDTSYSILRLSRVNSEWFLTYTMSLPNYE